MSRIPNSIRKWQAVLVATALLTHLNPASAWTWYCPPDDPYSFETWLWCSSEMLDPDYAVLGQVGVADDQSTSLGSPAVAYVARPSSPTFPYYSEVRTQIGSSLETVKTYTNTSTQSFNVISVPSLSVLPNGEAYVAWAELKTATNTRIVTIRCYSLDSSGNWVSEADLFTTGNIYSYRYQIGAFDVQIYDLLHYAYGGSWWTQANSTSDFKCKYRLKMRDDENAGDEYPRIIDIAYANPDVDYDGDDPDMQGPLPFSFKAGTSSTSPTSVVYNAPTSYDSYATPVSPSLKVFHRKATSPFNTVTEATLVGHYVSYFALVATTAGNRHVIYQDLSTPTTSYLHCTSSSAVGTWSTAHQPATDGGYSTEENYAEPITAVADPNANSDAFDVLCWRPEFYDPNILWVLRHSTGTNYVADYVTYDTSSTLMKPSSKAIGAGADGENFVYVSPTSNGSRLATN